MVTPEMNPLTVNLWLAASRAILEDDNEILDIVLQNVLTELNHDDDLTSDLLEDMVLLLVSFLQFIGINDTSEAIKFIMSCEETAKRIA